MFRLFDKISENQVYIIAEMSANHAGELENALLAIFQVLKCAFLIFQVFH